MISSDDNDDIALAVRVTLEAAARQRTRLRAWARLRLVNGATIEAPLIGFEDSDRAVTVDLNGPHAVRSAWIEKWEFGHWENDFALD